MWLGLNETSDACESQVSGSDGDFTESDADIKTAKARKNKKSKKSKCEKKSAKSSCTDSNLSFSSSESDTEEKKKKKNVEVHKSFLIVNLTWTKTIQTGERVLQMPLVPIKGSILCPVRAYKKMCKLIPSSDESPLFVLSNNKIVSYNMFQRKLRFLLQKAGLDSAKYSTHSFRRGSTTLLFRAEVPADQIQLMGDWRSDAYKNIFLMIYQTRSRFLKL